MIVIHTALFIDKMIKIGKESAICIKDISDLIGLPKKSIKHYIDYLVNNGSCIIHNNNMYYKPNHITELNIFLKKEKEIMKKRGHNARYIKKRMDMFMDSFLK